MAIPLLWLFLLLGLLSRSSLADSSFYSQSLSFSYALPTTYTDATPYQGLAFGSNNVTVPLRTQRDLALNVTIDHWLWPTLNMNSAYFGNDYSTEKLNNVQQVMAMGYRRLVLDLYWDSGRRQWQLCPAASMNDNSYTCATSENSFRQFMQQVNDYMISTNVSAAPAETDLLFLVFNLHPLQSSNTAVSSRQQGNSLSDTIIDIIGTDRIYTPSKLEQDRRNGTVGHDSWPTWHHLISDKVQLLLGLGSNELGNSSSYNTGVDLDMIFGENQLLDVTAVDTSSNLSQSLSHCTSNNGSWATLIDRPSDPFVYNTTLKATYCGYSPYFTTSNYTSSTTTNHSIITHLQDNVLGTIWSWDVGQPMASSNPHCTMIQRWNGRWRSGLCTELLRVACRHKEDPNKWMLTATYVSYDRAFSACPDNYVFDVPRVAVQNKQLFHVLQADLLQNGPHDEGINNPLHHLFWINLNTGSNGACWVVGLYSTCWWLREEGAAFANLIRTSAVAGVIILILVGIFIWVKCARSWRSRKARSRKNFIKELLARREYVTVPA